VNKLKEENLGTISFDSYFYVDKDNKTADDKMKFKIYLNKEAIYKGTITCVGWSSNNEVYSCG